MITQSCDHDSGARRPNQTIGQQRLPEFARERQVLTQFLPVARSTLWRWIATGKFPAPIKLTDGVTVWKRDDLLAWKEQVGGGV